MQSRRLLGTFRMIWLKMPSQNGTHSLLAKTTVFETFSIEQSNSTVKMTTTLQGCFKTGVYGNTT